MKKTTRNIVLTIMMMAVVTLTAAGCGGGGSGSGGGAPTLATKLARSNGDVSNISITYGYDDTFVATIKNNGNGETGILSAKLAIPSAFTLIRVDGKKGSDGYVELAMNKDEKKKLDVKLQAGEIYYLKIRIEASDNTNAWRSIGVSLYEGDNTTASSSDELDVKVVSSGSSCPVPVNPTCSSGYHLEDTGNDNNGCPRADICVADVATYGTVRAATKGYENGWSGLIIVCGSRRRGGSPSTCDGNYCYYEESGLPTGTCSLDPSSYPSQNPSGEGINTARSKLSGTLTSSSTLELQVVYGNPAADGPGEVLWRIGNALATMGTQTVTETTAAEAPPQ